VVLVPVAPFPSPRDEVDADELRCTWLGRSCPENSVSRLLVPTETTAALDALFGPRNAEALVTVVPIDDLPDHLWADPTAVAIVPFDRLEPRLKALSVDGQLALDRDVDLRRYPLLATVWARGPKELVHALAPQVQEQGLDTNRRPDRLTVLTMTGVTALTRRVALQIEAHRDYGWPARHLVDLLSTADLTHISHEVSFVSGCRAERKPTGLCAKPEYMKTLQLVGADLVELTGNHNLDFGPYHALQSLDLYAQAGMRTFGGGRNAAQARRPLLVTHNGNRLAFLGYNQFGPDYAWATDSKPGAAPFSLEAVRMDLAQVRPEADLIFVNIQHTETYSTEPLPAQVADFRAVVEAGANAVIGSQAHQPQAIEFHDGGLIFYGLGNLMFDQTWSVPTRQSLVIRHVIYDGRLIATQLIPTVFNDKYQPRPAEDSERKAILRAVFEASGW
jgi:poly-gamma-glutamate synthesis protein (capsule biosynthesis protein)